MKILLAPDSFKGCLSSVEVCNALEDGIKQFDTEIDIIKLPSSDGGEGFCDCMLNLFGGEWLTNEVSDPLGRPIISRYVFNALSETAYIEFASASGLNLISDEHRDILLSTSFGVGELISDAVRRGAEEIVVGLGGSATNDCGVGILAALGMKFYDISGCELDPIPRNIYKIAAVDSSSMLDLSKVRLIAACDVKNPLCGPKGAARVFAPQNGATLENVEFLDDSAAGFAGVLGLDPNGVGYGAAGGAGMALVGVLGAQYVSGAELLVNSSRFCDGLDNADLVITGEGNTDKQSAFGKLVSVVVESAKKRGINAVVISGGLSDGYDSLGADAYYALCENESKRQYAILNAYKLLKEKVVFALNEKRNGF